MSDSPIKLLTEERCLPLLKEYFGRTGAMPDGGHRGLVLANGEGPHPTGGKACRRSYVITSEMCDPCISSGGLPGFLLGGLGLLGSLLDLLGEYKQEVSQRLGKLEGLPGLLNGG